MSTILFLLCLPFLICCFGFISIILDVEWVGDLLAGIFYLGFGILAIGVPLAAVLFVIRVFTY